MGSYQGCTPGMTLLKACSRFLTQNNLVQVIIRVIINMKNQYLRLNQQKLPLSFIFQFLQYLPMKLLLNFLCTLIILTQIYSTEVSWDNLKGFFWATYDRNDDGVATMQQFVDYFRFMEPEHNITVQDVKGIHGFFDSNGDKEVTLKELIEVARIKVTVKTGHKQIHLGLTNEDGEMQVMWVSTPQKYNKPVVQFGRFPFELKHQEAAKYTTYNVGHGGFHGRIYRAVMTGLAPLTKYYYRVGDLETRTFSKTKYFTSAPLKVQQLEELRLAVVADMGTFAPFGHFVIQQIAKDHFIYPFNFVFLTGDIAYAGMNSQQAGEFQPIWDLYGELTQSFAAYTPFMPGNGNHQKYYNYTAYTNRYVLPRKQQNKKNLWFSFDYGQIHVVHFSSEQPYDLTSEQYKFLDADLSAARKNPAIQWIILGVHRAFYSSSTYEHANVTNLARNLQDLVNKYKVDIVQTGHVHDYQRSWPTYKGKAVKGKSNKTHYIQPEHPVYVVQGTGGAFIKTKYLTQPEWSVKRSSSNGYGRITIKGGHLKYQYITIPGGNVHDEWNIIKNVEPKVEVGTE